jgi:FkbM family methyltransferase
VGVVGALGAAARTARRLGLERALGRAVGVADSVLVRVGVPPLAASVDGVRVRGYLRHRSFLAHVGRGDYEPYSRALFKRELRPGRLVVDAGAHIGLYSRLACRTGARVLAIEPDPYNVAALRWNVRGCAGVRVVPKAVAGRSGQATFHVSAGTIGSSLAERPTGPGHEFEVELTTIDDELRNEDATDIVVKLDLEGAEATAVAGMRETVARADELVVLVEVNPAALAAFGVSDLVPRLEELGLECLYVDEVRRELVRPGGKKGNLLCRKAR